MPARQPPSPPPDSFSSASHPTLPADTAQLYLKKGPLFTPILLADEINRAPAKTQCRFHRGFDLHRLAESGLNPVLTAQDVVDARQLIRDVIVEDGILEYIARLVEPDYQRAPSYLALQQRKRALVVIFTDLSGGTSLQMLLSHVVVLARHSLPLVVTISNPDIHAAARQLPHDSLAVYERAATIYLLHERQVGLESLQERGVLTLDMPANQLSLAVIDRYLSLKRNLRL